MGLRGNSGHGGGESGRGVLFFFFVVVVAVLLRRALDEADWAPEFDFR